MSLESQIAELTEAVRENNELLKFMTEAARKGGGDKGDSGSRRSASKDDEDDGEKEKPVRRTRSSSKDDDDGEKTTRARSTKKDKVPTSKELSALTSKYLEVDNDDEYDRRRDIVKKIVAKFDVEKMSEIEDADRAEAMDLLQTAVEGKDPFPKRSRRDDDV